LTKIMTALLVLEQNRPDDIVVTSPEAATEPGSRLGLKPDEKMKAGDLLAAMLLMSANDACHALADHFAGTEAQFVSLMNRRAQALGLHQTSFKNACGHDQEGHLSSAQDLATLAQAAMAHPAFASLAATVRTTVSTMDGGRTFQLENKNELVGRYPGVTGVKTGFTAKGGKCVIAAAARDGRRVLLVLLNAPDRWWTAVAMLDHAFSASVPSLQAGPLAP
jgi:D-alanyl-D-alanine carboxypeptidase (penicillin-binding protein 5/6)